MGPLCARWTDMVKVRSFRNYGKTSRVPRNPLEKNRLDAELKLMGLFGLRTKREIWRVGATLAHVRKAARELLKLDEKDNRRGDCAAQGSAREGGRRGQDASGSC